MFVCSDDPLRYLPERPTFTPRQYYSTKHNDVLADFGTRQMDVLHGPQTRILVSTASRVADSDQITVPGTSMPRCGKNSMRLPISLFLLALSGSFLSLFLCRHYALYPAQGQIGRPESHLKVQISS